MKEMKLWKWALLLVGGTLVFLLLYALLPGLVKSIPVLWLQMPALVAVSVLLLVLYSLWVRRVERQPVTDLPMDRVVPDTGRGFLLGLLYISLTVGILALCGCYRVASVHFVALPFILNVFSFLVVAVGEEMVFRGVIFRMIDRRFNLTAALVVSAALFGGTHIMNDGATLWSSVAIAIEAGLLLGAAYKVSGNLWLPIGIHWAWNLAEGPVFGAAVSGTETMSILTPVFSGSDWITGGAFGVEASVVAVLLGAGLTAVLLLRRPK